MDGLIDSSSHRLLRHALANQRLWTRHKLVRAAWLWAIKKEPSAMDLSIKILNDPSGHLQECTALASSNRYKEISLPTPGIESKTVRSSLNQSDSRNPAPFELIQEPRVALQSSRAANGYAHQLFSNLQ